MCEFTTFLHTVCPVVLLICTLTRFLNMQVRKIQCVTISTQLLGSLLYLYLTGVDLLPAVLELLHPVMVLRGA